MAFLHFINGLTMITVVNKQYCKKILILLPGQSHPEQFHKIKEETFHVYGAKGRLTLDDVKSDLLPGSVHHVSQAYVIHLVLNPVLF